MKNKGTFWKIIGYCAGLGLFLGLVGFLISSIFELLFSGMNYLTMKDFLEVGILSLIYGLGMGLLLGLIAWIIKKIKE